MTADNRPQGAAPRVGSPAFRTYPRGDSAPGGPTRRLRYRLWSKRGLVRGPQRQPRVPSAAFRVGRRGCRAACDARGAWLPPERWCQADHVPAHVPGPQAAPRGLSAAYPHWVGPQASVPGPASSRGSYPESLPRELRPRRRVFPEMTRPRARSTAQAPRDSAAQAGQPIACFIVPETNL